MIWSTCVCDRDRVQLKFIIAVLYTGITVIFRIKVFFTWAIKVDMESYRITYISPDLELQCILREVKAFRFFFWGEDGISKEKSV